MPTKRSLKKKRDNHSFEKEMTDFCTVYMGNYNDERLPFFY